jgi:cytoskeletal protein RodZ
MTAKTVGEQLRAAREAQGLSLDDISQATRINKKFLEDLERDVPPKLPQTYVHAVLKAFAQEVGLDPGELLRSLSPPPPPPVPSSSEVPTPEVIASGPPVRERREEDKTAGQTKMVVVLVGVVVIGLIISITFLHDQKSTQQPKEIPFSDVVKEREARAQQPRAGKDTLSDQTRKAAALADSLLLEGTARESAFVRVTIDGMKTVESTWIPPHHARWKAKKSFVISLADGEAMTFTLNGKPMGVLGSAKKPLKNFVISQETLQRLRESGKSQNVKH